jgi:glycosyltransferase involved in cell wall biosynthesis
VVPLFNGEKWITECIESVFSQTRPADEVIVVDDGSGDNGIEKVRELGRSYPLTLLFKENGGQSATRNYGVAHAKSDLIAFLDQDDMWYPTHLERLEQEYEAHGGPKFGWVNSNLDRIDAHGLLVSKSFLNELGSTQPKHSVLSCLREDMFILPSASLISRAAFEAIGGFDPRLSGYEDDDLFLRMFQAGYSGLYVDECLTRWRIHEMSSSYSSRMARSRRIYCEKLIAAFPDNPRHNLYYVSGVIVPRFFRSAHADWVAALRSGNRAEYPQIIAELKNLTPLLGSPQRLAWKVALPFLAHYRIACWIRRAAQSGHMVHQFLYLATSPLRIISGNEAK